MPKICAQVAIENMVATRMLGTVFIKTDYCIQWGCAKPATSQTITR